MSLTYRPLGAYTLGKHITIFSYHRKATRHGHKHHLTCSFNALKLTWQKRNLCVLKFISQWQNILFFFTKGSQRSFLTHSCPPSQHWQSPWEGLLLGVTRVKSRGKFWLGLYFNLPMPPPNSSRQTDKNMKDSRVGRSVAWEFSETHELATVPRLDLLPPGPLWLCYVTLGWGHLEVTLRN